ncbi:hypothetical protein M422DRAFT_241185 [Sphaerobolus stellatus SS14]|nr:hypothetical protein M422DRAFT_241185 [Sphaerobolus stellatus SS14]
MAGQHRILVFLHICMALLTIAKPLPSFINLERDIGQLESTVVSSDSLVEHGLLPPRSPSADFKYRHSPDNRYETSLPQRKELQVAEREVNLPSDERLGVFARIFFPHAPHNNPGIGQPTVAAVEEGTNSKPSLGQGFGGDSSDVKSWEIVLANR